MSDELTTNYWTMSGAPSSSSSMANAAVIASVTVVCLILVAVAITILLCCCYRRRNLARKQKAEERRPKSSHGSSTMRSDKSDHPYENPSLPRNLRAKHAKQSSKPGFGQGSDPYSTLKGQSLPHHYQGLGQKPKLPDESVYDELMASSEGTNSDYYFKLEPGSRSDDGVRSGARLEARPGLDPTATDPDQAYDLVEIGNMTGNNANQNKDVNIGKDTSQEDGNPYYFKVDRSHGGSFTAPASIRNVPSTNSDRPVPSEKDDEAFAKPTIAAKLDLATRNSLEESSSYDKLDRSPLRSPKAEDINANEYNKLLPRVAVHPHNSAATSSDGYLKVKVGNQVDDADDDDSLMEVAIYNKLDRGVEKEIDNLIVADKKSSTAMNRGEDVPVEL